MPAHAVESVRKEDRECDKHGRVLHGFQLNGPNGDRIWRCTVCERERKMEYRERKANGGPVRSWVAQKEKPVGKTCEVHHIVLTALGECDYCS